MIRRLRRLSLSALCCVLLLSACATLRQGPVDADPLRLAPRTLDGQGRIGRLTYQGALVLSGGTARFGGFSVLHVDAGGEGVIAISDRGAVLRGRLRHDAEGRLTGFAVDRLDPLPGADGKPVRGEWSDAESLAPLPDGRFAVGFEHHARIGLYDSGFARPPTELPLPNGIEVEPNQGLETMAALADGRLLRPTRRCTRPGSAAPGAGTGCPTAPRPASSRSTPPGCPMATSWCWSGATRSC